MLENACYMRVRAQASLFAAIAVTHLKEGITINSNAE
jgi:hypothetical protein